jgi:hypothetical protein
MLLRDVAANVAPTPIVGSVANGGHFEVMLVTFPGTACILRDKIAIVAPLLTPVSYLPTLDPAYTAGTKVACPETVLAGLSICGRDGHASNEKNCTQGDLGFSRDHSIILLPVTTKAVRSINSGRRFGYWFCLPYCLLQHEHVYATPGRYEVQFVTAGSDKLGRAIGWIESWVLAKD